MVFSFNSAKIAVYLMGIGLYGSFGMILTLFKIGTVYGRALEYYVIGLTVCFVLLGVFVILRQVMNRELVFELFAYASGIYGGLVLFDLLIYLIPVSFPRSGEFNMTMLGLFLAFIVVGIFLAYFSAELMKTVQNRKEVEMNQ